MGPDDDGLARDAGTGRVETERRDAILQQLLVDVVEGEELAGRHRLGREGTARATVHAGARVAVHEARRDDPVGAVQDRDAALEDEVLADFHDLPILDEDDRVLDRAVRDGLGLADTKGEQLAVGNRRDAGSEEYEGKQFSDVHRR